MANNAAARPMTPEEKKVIFASSLGTVFEWYDFYLYGTLAVFFSALFFPPGHETAAFLASLATFGAGFAVACPATLTLRSTVVAANQATILGAGIYATAASAVPARCSWTGSPWMPV